MDKATFIKNWSQSLQHGTAAAFIGAGLSRRAGYPDWKTLLTEISTELGLDIHAEYDLSAVAQYSLNKSVNKRNKLTKHIVEAFPPVLEAPEPFRILARLPIRAVWTTNYDRLAETAWAQERKMLDVKSRNNDLGFDLSWSHATLYKMHGSVDHPSEVVIAKDDYEMYRRVRPGFLQVLSGQLVTSQMLFLGFSFTDPNLAHLFASIRESFEGNGPAHYAIVRRPKSKGSSQSAKKRFATDQTRHDLWVEDLQRYGINVVEVDEHEEIDDLLRAVELRLAGGSALISGSFPPERFDAHRKYLEAVSHAIGKSVAQARKRLVSGFGQVVGSSVVAGALEVILHEPAPNLEKSLLLRPFPQTVPDGFDRETFYARYRESMIQQAGVCIFIGGEKSDEEGNSVLADGVIKEFDIATRLGRIIVPIGCTGGAAQKIWAKLAKDKNWSPTGLTRAEFEKLNLPDLKPSEIEKLITKVLKAAGAV